MAQIDEKYYPFIRTYVNSKGERIGVYRNSDGLEKEVRGINPSSKGFYFNFQTKPNQTERERTALVDDFDSYNYQDNFEKAVKEKGLAAELAYKYHIMDNWEDSGNKEENEKTRVINWLSLDSYYTEHTFFYVTNVPNFQDKKVAFQLRISNHYINPKTWVETHMIRLHYPYGNDKKVEQMAQFALNLMVNRLVSRGNQTYPKFESGTKTEQFYSKYGATFYEKDLSLETVQALLNDDLYTERLKKIDAFLSNIGKGAAITVSFQDLEDMFGNLPNPSPWNGGTEYDTVNFGERQRLRRYLSKKNAPLLQWKTNEKINKTIPLSYLMDADLKDLNVKIGGEDKTLKAFKYDWGNGNVQDLAFDYDTMAAYPIKKKGGVLRNDIVTDPNLTVKVIDENRIKISFNDIKNMVNECVKHILENRGLI